jgi:cellulose biosynthesis protein BcsQ
VAVVPFGAIADQTPDRLDQIAAAAERTLFPDLAKLGRDPDTLVIMDTSPGPSRLTSAAMPIAELDLAILLADPASYAASAPLTARVREERKTGRMSSTVYALNQLDVSRALSRDVHAALSSLLGPRLIGSVHHDAAIGEALANQQSVLLYDRQSRASRDILAIAVWLDRFFDELENQNARTAANG